VAISEAVLLAADLSTDGSAAFVNGLLARLLEIRPTVVGEAADAAEGAAGTEDDEDESEDSSEDDSEDDG